MTHPLAVLGIIAPVHKQTRLFNSASPACKGYISRKHRFNPGTDSPLFAEALDEKVCCLGAKTTRADAVVTTREYVGRFWAAILRAKVFKRKRRYQEGLNGKGGIKREATNQPTSNPPQN